MQIKVCPICDQKMSSAHYCTGCRRLVRRPVIRNINYHLNERSPQDLVNDSFEAMRQVQPQMQQPNQQMQRANSQMQRPNPQMQRPNPQMYQPNARMQRTSPLFQQPTQQTPPINRQTPSGQMTGGAAGQNGWQPLPPPTASKKIPAGLVGVVVLAMILLTAFLFVAMSFRYDSPWVGSETVIEGYESGDPLEEFYLDEWDRDYEELDEDEVRAAGVACTMCGHFNTTRTEMEEKVKQIIENKDLVIYDEEEYSYNDLYSDGDTWFYDCITYYLDPDGSDMYSMVTIDGDTGTGALHEVDVLLKDQDQLFEVATEIMEYLDEQGDFTQDPTAIDTIIDGLRDAFEADEEYWYQIDHIYIYGHTFEGVYNFYISCEAE